MAFEIKIVNQDAGAEVMCSGVITGNDCFDANREVYKQDPHKKLRYQIWDFTRTERLNITAVEMHKIVLQDQAEQHRNPNQVIAFVGFPRILNGDCITYRIFSESWVGGGFKSRTFTTMPEARAWVVRHCTERQWMVGALESGNTPLLENGV